MSEFNSEPIDIIVPWVNPNDPEWRKEFEYWKQKETGQKDACRFRDMGVFNFWFRCIEQNMPWVRYVFLVLASPSQIPDWLNVNHPKLKIVYHDQFIPKEELPTFNSSVINCYMPFIEELSDNYILFNDDFFVIKPIGEEEFFINDTPVGLFKMFGSFTADNTPWSHNIKNNFNVIMKHFGNVQRIIPAHGPIAFKKSLLLFIHNKCKDDITTALHESRFRKNKNVTDWIFFSIAAAMNKVKKGTLKIHYANKIIPSANPRIVCFNDNELLSNSSFDTFRKNVFTYLHRRFPSFSRYEQ